MLLCIILCHHAPGPASRCCSQAAAAAQLTVLVLVVQMHLLG
jgi:hypothetical protein